MKAKPLQWSQSEVFGRPKKRGHGIGGEYYAYDPTGLSREEQLELEAEAQSNYEEWFQRTVVPLIEHAEPSVWMLEGTLRDGAKVLRLPVLTTAEEAERYAQRNPDEVLVPLYRA